MKTVDPSLIVQGLEERLKGFAGGKWPPRGPRDLIMASKAYAEIPDIYDRILAQPVLPIWQRARRRWLGDILPRVKSVCDLGCGTGTTALELARSGKKVFAVDLSAAMCRVARRKARQARLPIRVLQADLRTFRLPEPVDLVTSEYTVINHLLSRRDLVRMARAVARALRPGGFFFFDVSHGGAFEKVWARHFWFEAPGICVAKRGGFERASGRGWVEMNWFLRRGRTWVRKRERLDGKAWSASEIVRALRRGGFTRIRTYDSASLLSAPALVQPGAKTFFLAQKGQV